MPNIVENNAVDLVIAHLTKLGYQVQNVSKGKRRDSEHKGYDLLATKPGEKPVKIEVKGCSKAWGIPDPYETEFDSDRRLVADYLYVVYFCNGQNPTLCVIPRDAFKAEHITTKMTYRISPRFKNKKSLEPYLREL